MNPILSFGLIGVAWAIILFAVFGGFLWGAMWMPLPKKRVERMLELGDVTHKIVYDLGAGFGNMAFKAAGSALFVVAVEADPFKAWWIQTQIQRKKLCNVRLVKGNLLNVDLSGADVLLCYLSDGLMCRIAEKQLKQGCQIVSCCHKIFGWKVKMRDRDSVYPIYVYQVECHD